MDPAVAASASSMASLADQYRAITQNLANVNTAGYKRRRTSFSQVLAGIGGEQGALEVSSKMAVDHTPGHIMRTERSLDVAIEGEGFFQIDTPDGPRFTRNGTFRANATRQLVDGAGQTVAGQSGPITVPGGVSSSAVQISPTGDLLANGKPFGRLKVVRFADTTQMTPSSAGTFIAPDGQAGEAATDVTIRQGCQETSNVRAVEELTALISVSRLYEANVRAVSSYDERAKSLLETAMG